MEALSAECLRLAALPLSRHPRINGCEVTEEDWLPRSLRVPTLHYALGVLDPVEVVTVRRCDMHKPGHAWLFPDRHHGAWRWSPGHGVIFMDGTEPCHETLDLILAAVARELQRRVLSQDDGDQPARPGRRLSRGGAECRS